MTRQELIAFERRLEQVKAEVRLIRPRMTGRRAVLKKFKDLIDSPEGQAYYRAKVDQGLGIDDRFERAGQ